MSDEVEDFVCGCCGQTFTDWPPDLSFQRPDVIWSMDPKEREARAWESSDFCALDDRSFFVRGVLYIPLQEHDKRWGLGLWAEVSQDDFERYLTTYDVDGSDEPPLHGTLANEIQLFGGILGEHVQIRLGNATQRPSFIVLPTSGISTSEIAIAQMNGLPDFELHQILGKSSGTD